MDLTPSRVTNLLNSLEKKGYVVREISSQDRRIIKISLTTKGESFATNIQTKYVKFHEDILLTIENEHKLHDMLCSLKSFHQILEDFLKNKGEEKDERK
jgi:DNA-binding MarR family transcriptional regulator